MGNEIIRNSIIGSLESLVEMVANVTETNGIVHQLDMDITLEQIRKLYLEVQQLDVENRKAIQLKLHSVTQPKPESMPVSENHTLVNKEPVAVVETPRPEPAPIAEPVVVPEPVIETKPVTEPESIVVELKEEPVITVEPAPVYTEPIPEIQPVVETIIQEPVAEMPPAPVEEIIPEIKQPEIIPAPIQTVSAPETNGKQTTLADKFIKEDNSINQQMRANNQARFQKLNETPVANLRTAIGINDKFMFVNELFKGEMKEYDFVIQEINAASDESAALEILNQKLSARGTADKTEAISKLCGFIHRRFM